MDSVLFVRRIYRVYFQDDFFGLIKKFNDLCFYDIITKVSLYGAPFFGKIE
jgi:hypothetical protein